MKSNLLLREAGIGISRAVLLNNCLYYGLPWAWNSRSRTLSQHYLAILPGQGRLSLTWPDPSRMWSGYTRL